MMVQLVHVEGDSAGSCMKEETYQPVVCMGHHDLQSLFCDALSPAAGLCYHDLHSALDLIRIMQSPAKLVRWHVLGSLAGFCAQGPAVF